MPRPTGSVPGKKWSDGLRSNMVAFLNDGGDRDAAFVLEVCDFWSSESPDAVGLYFPQVYLDVSLTCPALHMRCWSAKTIPSVWPS